MSVRIIAVCLLLAVPVRADWKRLEAEAADLVRKPDELDRKIALIEAAGRDDSARAATLLAKLAASSVVRQKDLARRVSKTRSAFVKIDRKLRKKHGRRADLEGFSNWRKRRDELDRLKASVQVEETVQEAIGFTVSDFRAREAVAVFASLSDRTVATAMQSLAIRKGVLKSLWGQPIKDAASPLLRFAEHEDMPLARVRILAWIGEHRMKEGFSAAVKGLRGPQPVVVRAAVAALKKLNDPDCVPDLIAARQTVMGLAAEELEIALHFYTGKKFFGAGAGPMWKGWWGTEGAAWLRGEKQKRYEAKAHTREGAAFYGIVTRSNRIVFVLDRSGSMKEPVPYRGPITGKSDDRVPGKTKLEVAKNQLARTIRQLPIDAMFAVVFYSHDVEVWAKPPKLVTATAKNKKLTIDWFMAQKPDGSTHTFDALEQALRYANVYGGSGKSATDTPAADTIFLLSDGAPTDRDTLLTGVPLEEAIQAFFAANRAVRCVVHTIGVGPDHNGPLMQRLALETGGTYKAVAMK